MFIPKREVQHETRPQTREESLWGRRSGVLTADAEEISEQFDGFGLQDAAFDLDGVVEAGVGGDVMEGPCVAGFRVGAAKTRREIRATWAAPAHIGQGSSVA